MKSDEDRRIDRFTDYSAPFVNVTVTELDDTHNHEETSGTKNGSSEGCRRRTISGSTKHLSNQGSLKNHFLK